jgi:hypothetical protein
MWDASGTATTPLYEGASFQTPTLTQTTTYYVESVQTNCSSASRTAVQVTVEQLITNNSISAEQVICAGGTPIALTGTLPAGGTGTYTYRWESSTESVSTGYTAIVGATTQGYVPSSLKVTTWFRQ